MPHAAERDGRDLLMSRLEEHAGMPEEDIDTLKFLLVAMDYVARFNYCGALIAPGKRYYRKDGTEHKFEHVPFPKILEAVENRIGKLNPPERRLAVFEKVMEGIERGPNPQTPKWALPPLNPNEKPTTPWSKAPEGQAKTNAELIDALAAAAELDDRQASHIATLITWGDGSADGKSTCFMTLGPPGKISGGRLGRDHTLDDVPSHFVRDCVLDYITTQVRGEAKKRAVEKAVFPDLTGDDIALYRRTRQEIQKAREEEESIPQPPPKLSRLEQALADIDTASVDLGLTYLLAAGVRDYDRFPPIRRSVVYAGKNMLQDEEDDLEHFRDYGQVGIGYDCDQVRAMIKTFIRQEDGEWNVEDFRYAIEVTRPQMLAFLQGRGPSAGKSSLAYQRSWEFFERRREMGYELEDDEEMPYLDFDDDEEEDGLGLGGGGGGGGDGDGAEESDKNEGGDKEGEERNGGGEKEGEASGDGDREEEERAPDENGDNNSMGEPQSTVPRVIMPYYTYVPTPDEVKKIAELERALAAVNLDINLIPHTEPAGKRDYRAVPAISRSVMEPGGSRKMTFDEAEKLHERQRSGVEQMTFGAQQVRAMVKRFVQDSKWSMDDFRLALGLSRQKMIAFLEGKGQARESYRPSAAYQLCWEFFDRRKGMRLSPEEVLGLVKEDRAEDGDKSDEEVDLGNEDEEESLDADGKEDDGGDVAPEETLAHIDYREQAVKAFEARFARKEFEARCAARYLEKLDIALEAIDTHGIDLTPDDTNPEGQRNYHLFAELSRSVVQPGSEAPLPIEASLRRLGYDYIDLDCDQVRASIRILVQKGGWTTEQFCFALQIPPQQLLTFLEFRGPAGGKKSMAYQLCWEFFDRRRELGLGLEDGPDSLKGSPSGRKHGREQGPGGSPMKKKSRPSV